MASQSNTGKWIGAASSENSIPRNLPLKLEEDPSWKAPASSQNTTNMDVKSNVGTPNSKFPGLECKEVLEQEWYTPETSLMELSSYSSSPYGISDTRSGFGLLDASLNFDSTSNLISSFRSAPSTLGMDDLQNALGRDPVLDSSQVFLQAAQSTEAPQWTASAQACQH